MKPETLQMIATVLGIVVSAAILLGYVIKFSVDMSQVKSQVKQLADVKLEQMKFQVEQLWNVIFANAKSELLSKGLAEIKSPIRIVSEGYEFIKPYLGEYLPIYQQAKRSLDGLASEEVERRLFQVFQQQESESIIKQICLPRGLTLGAGIMAVIQACQWAEQGGSV